MTKARDGIAARGRTVTQRVAQGERWRHCSWSTLLAMQMGSAGGLGR
jgi:hypothetical protein